MWCYRSINVHTFFDNGKTIEKILNSEENKHLISLSKICYSLQSLSHGKFNDSY